MNANQLRKRVEELIELEKRATGDGGDYYDYMRALHDSAPTLLPAMLAAVDAVEAAEDLVDAMLSQRPSISECMALRAARIEFGKRVACFDAKVAEVPNV